jgi:DNA (cytosine-5)-methyltransferase 1
MKPGNLNPIPIIDIFAGPGGLGEGFCSLTDNKGNRLFEIKLSIEKDEFAHQTLKLRSFFRQFPVAKAPEEYYQFVRGQIGLTTLYELYPNEAAIASAEAWCGTLGTPDQDDKNPVSNIEVDERIRTALGGNKNWLLIGGPPCQAYSLAGRSRRQETVLDSQKDKRVGLYKEYLRIIAVHHPAVFVMENVKGLLSAKTAEEFIFNRILSDLSDPVTTCISEGESLNGQPVRYKIYSLTTPPKSYDISGSPVFDPKDFLIKAEDYGVPQKRHRVILLGVREDINPVFDVLVKKDPVSLRSVIGQLPILRSGISRRYMHSENIIDTDNSLKKKRVYETLTDSYEAWFEFVNKFDRQLDTEVDASESHSKREWPRAIGKEFVSLGKPDIREEHPLFKWYTDKRLSGTLHHVSRKHLVQDLKRYLFAARYTSQHGNFPRLEDYRLAGHDLVPNHENVDSGKFTDRFRVQLPDIPATTVTSHISKDGHYFIHFDSVQCRTFTVREAARVQTFPDNYFFCGERTQQFHQVGNAVPPYLAYKISEIVHQIFQNHLLNLNKNSKRSVKTVPT